MSTDIPQVTCRLAEDRLIFPVEQAFFAPMIPPNLTPENLFITVYNF
jgi:hypothetical protein